MSLAARAPVFMILGMMRPVIRLISCRLALHLALPPPHVARRQKVFQPHGLGHERDLWKRVVDEFRQTHHEALVRRHTEHEGGMSVRDIL